jgi:hypothetical protein
MLKDRATVFSVWAKMLINFAHGVKQFRAIENTRRVPRTGRGEAAPVRIAVVANHLSDLEVASRCRQIRQWRLDVGDYSGQRIGRTGDLRSSSGACRKGGGLCTIIRQRLRRRPR